MIRLAIVLVFLAGCATAQQAKLSVELSAQETAVGQPVVLRVKVLVPTFMPRPPVFPDVEVPGLLVRLPERATSPISERVDGETWAGIQRAYRLYPLSPGTVTLPAQEVSVTYSRGGPTDTVTERLALPQLSFAATVPPGARDLSPLIVATGFALEEDVEGAEDLTVGGAITRTITARIEGTTPILIPPLSPDADVSGLRAYADEPVVTETEDRGTLSGARSERVVYVPQQEGRATLPAIGFDWFNLTTNMVERAELSSHEVTIAPGANPPAIPPDPEQAARRVAALLAGLALAYACWRWLVPPVRRAVARARERWRGSEVHAHRQVRDALRRRNLAATMTALDVWSARVPALPYTARRDLADALAEIGATRFAASPGADGRAWKNARRVYEAARRSARDASLRRQHETLPALNPGLGRSDTS